MRELSTNEVQHISGGKSPLADLPPALGAPVSSVPVNQPLLDGQPKTDLA
jgi:hypothetical protein